MIELITLALLFAASFLMAASAAEISEIAKGEYDD